MPWSALQERRSCTSYGWSYFTRLSWATSSTTCLFDRQHFGPIHARRLELAGAHVMPGRDHAREDAHHRRTPARPINGLDAGAAHWGFEPVDSDMGKEGLPPPTPDRLLLVRLLMATAGPA